MPDVTFNNGGLVGIETSQISSEVSKVKLLHKTEEISVRCVWIRITVLNVNSDITLVSLIVVGVIR